MKRKTLLAIIILILACLTGCTYTTEVVEKDTSSIVIEESYESGQTQVTDEIKIKDEPFSLICTYDMGEYPLKTWRVTSNKSINMSVKTKNLPENYKVHIEHVHADIFLKSTSSQIDGIIQDSMDDSDHRIPSVGFPISNTIEYNNTFSIEGYTDQFYTLWGFAFGNYGAMSSSYQRLTELNIRKVGTYAEKLAVVYDIVISTPECEEGYVKSIYSEVLIPLVSNTQKYECIKEFKLPMYDKFGNPSADYRTVHKGSIYQYSEGYGGEEDIRLYLKDGNDDFAYIDITYEYLEEYFKKLQ